MCYTVLESLSWKHLGMSMRNDDHSTPVVQGKTLIYLCDGQDSRLTVGTPAWYAWLGTATAKKRVAEFLRNSRPLADWLDANVGESALPARGR